MQALNRLQDKIQAFRESYDALKLENKELRAQVDMTSLYEEEIAMLKQELSQKDAEIESIIAKIESLLE